ncbi:GNAT family N-acetyltransferase [Evansella halocellulosilytica]|uniref:GNAT family N-acetyltransferase n=1 Tax=Evansella halocellulosilytica TaxID=2011013 RepID=UPI000BB6ED0D|nr:GNAT family N-acetyltransferase [Evansella halocellulosilytica]
MTVKVVNTAEESKDAFFVRKTVFIEEQNVPEEIEVDQYEDESIHFVAYEKGSPVGAGRLRILGSYGKVERICVLKSVRSHGVGEKLMSYLEQVAKEEHITELRLNAQIRAERFYKRLGYDTYSDQFFDAGIPHVSMKKIL